MFGVRQGTKRSTLISIASIVLTFLLCTYPCLSASHSSSRIVLDLFQYGFPAGTEDVLLRVFYLSNDRVALLFDQQLPSASAQNHALKLMVLDAEGHPAAQMVIHADPRAVDITAGPGGGVLFGREGTLDFYDSKLQLLRSTPLASGTTGVKFDRQRNQLVILTVDEKAGQRTAHFRDGNSLEESVALSYPIESQAVFGKDELVYVVTGNCTGAARVVSNIGEWSVLDRLPSCDPLTFVERDSLAYASDDHLFIVDSKAHNLLKLRIPAPSTFELPGFVGLSDDHTRLAINAVRRENIASGWPYYGVVFLYDLPSNRLIFEHAMKKGSYADALSPNGHQLAIVERGTLTLLSLP